MKGGQRILALLAAIGGGALLLWKGWDTLVWFLYTLIAGTLMPESAPDPFLPDFLVVAAGFVLVAVAQVVVIQSADPAKRGLHLTRGTLLVVAALAGLKVMLDLFTMFRTLAVSSGSDPSKLESDLQSCYPFFTVALVALALSAIVGALGTGSWRTGSGGAARGVESLGWILCAALFGVLGLFFGRLDQVFEAGPEGAADPAGIAQQITNIIKFHCGWLAMVLLLGIAALVSAFIAGRGQPTEWAKGEE